MIAKLRSNFRLANVLARVLFVLMFVFANWQSGLMGSVIAQSIFGASLGSGQLWIAFLSVTFLGVAWMFLMPLIVNGLLNLARIYSVPRSEYCLIAHLFFAFGYFLNGCLNLVHLFTPVMLVWGGVLFPFVSSLVAAILFYKVTAKLYFNDLTVVNYFKIFAIVYLVLLFVLEVL